MGGDTKVQNGFIFLETGEIFCGVGVGIEGIVAGDIVFNTAMTGYQEIITDPSYAQQIITFTYPHIGNTGINLEDMQSSKIHASAIVASNISNFYSNWRASMSLRDFLITNNIVSLSDIDTRGLTQIIRAHGTVYSCVLSGRISLVEAREIVHAQRIFKSTEVIRLYDISTSQPYTKNTDGKTHVVLVDFGVKEGIINCLVDIGCKVTVVPFNTSFEEICSLQPEGIVLSNGPGDPQMLEDSITTAKLLITMNIPMLGICLGHQLLALAYGCKTSKMPFGHHGSNHPVKDLESGKVYISSQNHNYCVDDINFSDELQVTHRSLFDDTIQGFKHKYLPIWGVQGHPEAEAGPHDLRFVFTKFLNHMREYCAT